MWLRVRELREAGLVDKGSRGTAKDAPFGLWISPKRLFAFVCSGPQPKDYVYLAESANLPVGRWLHLALTADANRVSLYRDGTLIRQEARTFPVVDNNRPLYLGAMGALAEARLNQTIANLYELQVRQGNLMAQRHHRRSQRFFFGMLAAQAGVIIATFAMAARRRNLLWGLAAAAGVVAVVFAAYVYLYV